MRRFVIFGLLGPLLGHAVAFFVVFPVAIALEGARWAPKHLLLALITLPYGYLFGIVPALLSCAFDHFMKREPSHIVWTAISGIIFSLPVLWLFAPFSTPANVVAAACIGGIPAAVCAWLSDKRV